MNASEIELIDVDLFTDGGADPNPGKGAWAVMLRAKGKYKEFSQAYRLTTNNRMELAAAIQALKILIEPCHIKLHTDSKYVLDGITKWIHGWQRNGWKNASKQPVRNADLWHDLIEATARHQVEWIWVKGHNGHPENERADRLASDAADAASNTVR
jgi:ribonuclease HI